EGLLKGLCVEFIPISRYKPTRFFDNKDYINEYLKNAKKSENINLHKFTDFANRWLKEFDLGDKIRKLSYKNTFYEFQIRKNNKWFDIIDNGSGVIQLIPIILNISSQKLKKGFGSPHFHKTIIIEEPEINLHPKFQSKLADFFVDAIKNFDISIILETHSEYLIRKLQYLTAKKEIKPADTIIHYFHHPDKIPKGEEQFKQINILEDGSLSKDFGPGFFDEADNLAMELFKYTKISKN
ncbi:MAG: DUF3696 domain-containing protein, partial [Candidatus Marinimicrobia bacterium]|nr:DUF3696 domain-containing protein [Candidatus Neomarinimicrobiota bacterium]